ncbi:MAG TPA: hypothetical protein VF576_02020 [Rubricoccaceae bacterium]|jgi:hypothetical protein
MTTLAAGLPAPPVAAIETGFLLFATPLVLLMVIWAVVTAVRILVPEAPIPTDPAARLARSRRRGEAAPVRVREIVEEQRRRPTPVFPRSGDAPGGVPGGPAPDPLADALWARRN